MKDAWTAAVAALSMVLAGSSAARAANLIDFTGPTAELASPGFVDFSVTTGGGEVFATFTIDGIGTLDGIVANNLEDDFLLTVNGAGILNGTWDLGGGGQDFVSFAPVAATIDSHSDGIGLGGVLHVTLPIILNPGVNTIRFAYSSAVPQGLDDEGWDLRDFTLTSPTTAPEPAAWALMLTGFLGAGASLRRRQKFQQS